MLATRFSFRLVLLSLILVISSCGSGEKSSSKIITEEPERISRKTKQEGGEMRSEASEEGTTSEPNDSDFDDSDYLTRELEEKLVDGGWVSKHQMEDLYELGEELTESYLQDLEEVEQKLREAEHNPHYKDARITLKPRYKKWKLGKDDHDPRLSVDEAVIAACTQAGIGYARDKSLMNTDPTWSAWIAPVIEDMPFEEAMEEILNTTALTYIIQDNQVVLIRAYDEVEPIKRPVTLKPPYLSARMPGERLPRVSLQYAVMNLGMQVGLDYAFYKSQNNTLPLCWEKIDDVVIEDMPFEEAMEEILAPFDLTYVIEDDTIILKRAESLKKLTNKISRWSMNRREEKKDRTVSLKPPFTGWNPQRRDPADEIAVLHAASALCQQAGMGFDRKKSVSNTKPKCMQRISPFIDKEPWEEAMEKVLAPLDLDYSVENNQVVLVRVDGAKQ